MHKDEKGFTLMELMVVIVIVAILAAVAVPLYINYVNDARRTEAKAAIGAIITAEQAYYLKSPGLPGTNGVPTYTDLPTLKTQQLVNISDAERTWEFDVAGTATGFTVTATLTSTKSSAQPITVAYNYVQGQSGTFTP